MQTTISIDETLLREAEDKARRLGKSFSNLVEDALRDVMDKEAAVTALPMGEIDKLEDNDPFFAALEEVRAAGRILFVADRLGQAE